MLLFWAQEDKRNKYFKNNIYNIIEDLIVNKDVSVFLFGSKSQFDSLCHKIVTDMKGKYTYIKRIYIRAEYAHINDDYKKYLLQNFEDTYYPEKLLNAGKSVYVERNYEMIDKSEFCIVYYDENYTPSKKQTGKKDDIPRKLRSGMKIALNYAIQKNRYIVNLQNYI